MTSRRRFIGSVGGGAITITAGCLGDDGGEGGGTEGGSDGGTTTGTARESYEFTHAVSAGPESLFSRGSELYAKKVEEMSNGRITIDVASGGQYGGEAEQLSLLGEGGIDFATFGACLPEIVNIGAGMLECASVFTYETPVWDNYIALRRELYKRENMDKVLYEQAGLKQILPEEDPASGQFFSGYQQIATKTPVQKPGDAEGVPIRSPEAEIFVRALEGIGFGVETIPLNEIASAVRQGIVEGSTGDPTLLIGADIHNLSDYLIEVKMVPNSFYFIANRDSYDQLSAEDQQLLHDAQKAAKEESDQNAVEYLEDARQTMRDSGMEIISNIDQDAMRSAARSGLEPYIKELGGPLSWEELLEVCSTYTSGSEGPPAQGP